jgi:hypothetical protein
LVSVGIVIAVLTITGLNVGTLTGAMTGVLIGFTIVGLTLAIAEVAAGCKITEVVIGEKTGVAGTIAIVPTVLMPLARVGGVSVLVARDGASAGVNNTGNAEVSVMGATVVTPTKLT